VPVGRISGPLLKDNLERNGINLAFETDLLYLDVNNQKIGVNNNNPQFELDVNGTVKSFHSQISDSANIATIEIKENSISTSDSVLYLNSFDNIVYQKKLIVDSIQVENNIIRTINSNANLELEAAGTGTIEVFASMDVDGDIHATGNITANGNITIGDANTDNIVFNSEIASNVIPDLNDTYSLGSDPTTGGNEWSNIFAQNLFSTNISVNSATISSINPILQQGNIFYVAENGNDSYTGTHPQDPFLTIKHALSQASSGDTVHIYPGVYTEIFPLIVPTGVSVKGHSIRSVSIRPTEGTNDQDAFLLNGETTLEDLTVTGFYYNSVANTGHAFRFASNVLVSSRSPYIRNVTVITEGSSTTAEDPRGFNTGDAGKGVYADGSVVNSNSNEASMLFHSATFICPGVNCVNATNGVRIEWLNCFTYFADKSVNAFDGTNGKYNIGKTKLRVDGLSGTYTVGETISYYDQDGTTLLASGTIDSIDIDGKISLTNKGTGEFLEPDVRGGKTVVINGDAQINTATKKYGIGSLQLDGVGDYLSIDANDDFGFGTGDFTVETWIYLNDLIDNQQIFDFRSGNVADISPVVYVSNGGQLQYYVYNSSRIIGTSLSSNTWYHIALVRDNGNTRLYVNGSQVGVTYTDTNDYGSTKPCTIGARFDGANGCNAFFDDFRVIKGQAAYTSNFTAPTFQLTVTAETVLMLRFDTAIEDDVIYAQDIRFSGGATATELTLVDYREFGAEIRMIGSASIYGNYGLYGDGPGVLIYAIGHNLAYIGNGKEVTNDPITVIQTREITKLNNAKIYYTSVNHKGDFRVGEYFYVNQESGAISFATNNLDIDVTNGITFTTNGSTTFISGEKIDTGNLRFQTNTISSVAGDINLDAYSDVINLKNNVNIFGNLDIDGDLTIGGNLTLGGEVTDTISILAGIQGDIVPIYGSTYNLGSLSNTWSKLFTDEVLVDNIEINTNYITTLDSNSNLELRANGTGSIQIDDLNLYNSTISSINEININPGNGIAIIDSNKALRLPVGTTADRPSVQSGQIRFNSQLNRFEGYDGNYWIQLHGVEDVDGDTKITAELTQGANDNTIRFIVAGNTIADIDQTRLRVDRLLVDEVLIDNNVITTNTAGTDLEINALGTGKVTIDNFTIKNNQITNTVNGSITEFINTNNGYVKFAGTFGLVIPHGGNPTRPVQADTEVGMLRYNSQGIYCEIYTGTQWLPVAGQTGAVNRAQAEEIAIENVLILG